MSLLKGDDVKTNFIQASSIVANVIAGKQFQNTSPITAYLSAQPCNFNSLNGSFTTLNVEGAAGIPGQTLAFYTSNSSATVVPGNSVITETGAGDGAGGVLLYTGSKWTLVANSGAGGSGSGGSGGVPANTVITSSLVVSGPISSASLSATAITCNLLDAGTLRMSSFQAPAITGTSSIVGGAITGSSVNALAISSSAVTCGALSVGAMRLSGFNAEAITGSTMAASVLTGTSSIASSGAITGFNICALTSVQALNITGTSSIASAGAITGLTVAATNSVQAPVITGTSSIASAGAITGLSISALTSVQAPVITGTSSIASAGAVTGLRVHAASSLLAPVITGTLSIVGGAITGSSVNALSVSASTITCGLLASAVISFGGIQIAAISGSTVAANTITGTSSIASGGAITGLSVRAINSVQAATVTGTSIVGGAITGLTIRSTSVQAPSITGTSSIVSVGTINGLRVNAVNSVQAAAITGVTSIAGGDITGLSVNSTTSARALAITGTSSIATSGAITGSSVSATNSVQAPAITGTLTVNGSAISGSTISAATMSGSDVYSTVVSSTTVYSPSIDTTDNTSSYNPLTLVIKNDSSVTPIPVPLIEGEMYVGANAGRSTTTYFSVLPTSLAPLVPYWVVEFNNSMWWGGVYSGGGQILRTDYDGNLISTLTLSGGFSNATYCCYVDTNTNRLYFGGDFTSVTGMGSVACNYIAYLDSNLTVNAITDTSGSNGLNGVVYSIRDGVIYGTGSILVGGAFTATSNLSVPLYRVAYFYVNAWYASAQIDNNTVYDAIIVNNGSTNVLIIGGDFTSYTYNFSPSTCANIIGYDPSGSPTPYFPIGSGSFTAFNGTVKCFEYVPSNSRLYVGGSFSSIDSTTRQYCTYFNTSDFISSQSFDFPLTCESIYYASISGRLYRGGSSYVGITDTSDELYTSPSPFSQGMAIGYKNAFWRRNNADETYIVTQSGGNGAYIYEPVAATAWSSTTPIFPNYTGVSAGLKGAAFTLIGTLVGTAGWYVESSINCNFT